MRRAKKSVTDQMSMGYPRFKVHNSVELLTKFTRDKYAISDDIGIIILPGMHVAERFVAFAELNRADKGKCSIRKYEDIPERAQDLISWTTYPLEHFASKAKAFLAAYGRDSLFETS